MSAGLGGQAAPLCEFCKHRAALDDAIASRDWLRKRNQVLRERLIRERQQSGRYPLHSYVEGDLVDARRVW